MRTHLCVCVCVCVCARVCVCACTCTYLPLKIFLCKAIDRCSVGNTYPFAKSYPIYSSFCQVKNNFVMYVIKD